jgi:hypothetical protein
LVKDSPERIILHDDRKLRATAIPARLSDGLWINVAGHTDLEILLIELNHAYKRRRQRVLYG